MQRVAGGDRDAFAQLYDELGGVVHGLAARVVRDPARAEEVTRDVFVQVWRLAARFDPVRGTARAWVATVAHRGAVDSVRADLRSGEPHRREGREGAAAHVGSGSVVDARSGRDPVAQALGHLTDGQREAIVLAYFDGRTHREIAQVLDVPLGTVKSRIRDALMGLRDQLEIP